MENVDYRKTSCKVEYIVNELKVLRTMTQEQLSDLLKYSNVHLVSVNAPKATYYRKTPYKKKK